MLVVQSDKAAKELQEYKLELERRLTNMVAGFAYEVTVAASGNTPVGNAEDLAIGLDNIQRSVKSPETNYALMYLSRFKRFGIQPDVEFHKGAWYYSSSGSPVADRNHQDHNDAAIGVNERVLDEYKVGEKFYIVGKGPAFTHFEAGGNPQAPDGILGPTIENIRVAYAADLYKYFNQN